MTDTNLDVEEKENIELILDNFERNDIKTIYNREELKKRIVKIKDYQYCISIPIEAITDKEIKIYCYIKAGLNV